MLLGLRMELTLAQAKAVAHRPLGGFIGKDDLQVLIDHQYATGAPRQRTGKHLFELACSREIGRDHQGARRMLAEEFEGLQLAPFELSLRQRSLHAESDDEVRQGSYELRGESADPIRAEKLRTKRIAGQLVFGEQFGLAAHAA